MARTARGKATKEAFREGARTVFARNGYLNARLVDIAEEAGRSTALLYQHYDGKEAILADLAVDLSEQLQEAMRAPFRAGLAPIPALRQALESFWRHMDDHLAEFVGISQAALVDPDFAHRWADIHRAATELATTGIRQAQAEGFAPGLNAAVAGSALVTMVEQSCLQWRYLPSRPADAPDAETAIETLWQLWGHGIYWTTPLPAPDE
jgi:AcrR family transcriptional regulator